MKLNHKFKLQADPDQKELLRETMFSFNNACNFVSAYAFQNKIYSKRTLQIDLYLELREKFNLPAQMAIRVFSKVADAYKSEKTKSKKDKRKISLCKFRKYSAVPYDSRILTYGKNNIISIKTLEKRLKIQAIFHDESKIPFFQGEADLIYKKGEFYLSQTLEVPTLPQIETQEFLGVDLGIVNIAVDSDGEFHGENNLRQKIEEKRIQYSSHRKRLEIVKTASSRRRLKKQGNKEARFRKDINHQISKQIVQKAQRTSRGIALEELKQFFDKTRVRKPSCRGKASTQRTERSSWSFYQLRSFVSYKAKLAGIPVILVNPAYTSQECSVCGSIDEKNRKTQSKFLCVVCGHEENADFNSSKVISKRAVINQPIVTSAYIDSVTSPHPRVPALPGCGGGN